MRTHIQFTPAVNRGSQKFPVDFLDASCAQKARGFHSGFPGYRPTPFVSLQALADKIGVAGLFVKDESFRFGLNSFKSLGGSFAIGSYLACRLGMKPDDLTFEKLTSEEYRRRLGSVTFVTATDGNHGRGVAWTAKQLQQQAVVYLPAGSSPERLEHIRAEGARAEITRLNYDDTVCFAAEEATRNKWVLVQDTAFENYVTVPQWVMQGYTTMALEAYEELAEREERPTHIFLQAGVGSMSAAVAGFFANVYRDAPPAIVIVEPEKADCIFRTAQVQDGTLRVVTGSMDTIMAGLACGRPSEIGWPILRDYACGFLSCSDSLAAKGMRILAVPVGGDAPVTSGESGAVGVGAAVEILTNPRYSLLRQKLRLNSESKILCFSTEGDTDRDSYRKIVWEGAFPGAEQS